MAAAAGHALVEAQPAMAPMVRLANEVLWQLESACGVAEASKALEKTCRQFMENLEQAGPRISRHASILIPDGATVLTHSFSRTVLDALVSAREGGNGFRVVCTESRPVGEGAALARELAKTGIPATLVIDAAVLAVMGDADVALTGADAVSPAGLVNKTGTSLLALAARERGRPLYSLCDTAKFVPDGYELPEQPLKPPEEILPDPPWNVTVRNFYFDTTPLDLLSGIVTEEGLLTPGQVRRRLLLVRAHPSFLAQRSSCL